ncbi:hypothetical protein GmHk_10G029005 [Glycine max]|nr:hypothetical protein GmHk_10G029005 [Glycine max]
MDEDQWMYDSIISEEVDMDDQNEQECGVNEQHVDCLDAFNISQWAQSIAHENEFVAVIMRFDTNTGSRGRTSFMLIGCERSGQYRSRKKDFVKRDTGSRKYGCPFKLRGKPVVGGKGWMVKLMCEIHNHELIKSLVGQPYARRLTKDEKTIIVDMTKFHIDKNVKAKYKSLIGQKNAWEYVMDAWGSLVESAHWALKRVLQNSLGDLCSIWDAMNNMITLQHTEIKASFETSTHVVGHVLKKTLYKRPLGMVSRYALNQIAAEFERVHYASKNPSCCGCVMRTTHGLPCACELSKYVVGSIPLDSIHMFWRKLSFSDQGLSEPEVTIKEEMETISKRFEELDVCGKFTLKSKLREIAYPNQNSMCPPPAKVNTKGASKKLMNRNQRSTKHDPSYWEYVDALHSVQNSNSSVKRSASSSDQPNPRRIMPMLDQFQPFIHDFIDNIVDVKADGNCGYRSIAGLLGMGEESWSLVRNHLLKELAKFSYDYIKLFGGTGRFDEFRRPLLVDGLTKV